MINAIGFAPHPRYSSPEVASGAAVELDDLRVACDQLVADLVSSSDSMILLGSGRASNLAAGCCAETIGRARSSSWWHRNMASRYQTIMAAAIASEDRVAVLAMGDGSACRTEKAPGYLDDRSIDFDNSVADAFRPRSMRQLS